MELGTLGVWTTYRAIGEENAGEAAALVEQLGYGTFWLGGSPRLPSVRPLLEATEHIVVATSIVNVWAYEPADLAAEYAELARDFPDRLLVGIGVGHPEAARDYSRPLTALREFLDGLDAADTPLPRDRRCLAALAPKTLALSAERSLGTIPYFTPVAHTRAAREQLGPDVLVAPELALRSTTTPRGHARRRGSTRAATSASATTRTTCSATASPSRTSRTAAPTGCSTPSFPMARSRRSRRSPARTSTPAQTISRCRRSASLVSRGGVGARSPKR